ncbi:MAG: heme exporter protein CcmD [Colwellia sp.]|nr:heme exporter protein CcmD [Colwellia sp.]
MQFETFSAFLDMGGYGFYVWLSYGISTALLLTLIFSSIMHHKQVLKNIAKRLQREDKLRQVRQQRKNSQANITTEVTE